ncbi:MAG: response regulator transcription factor, partial [Solobacterium sp.]|nr:response regulator transcription factor [Solobacterium sp.]
MRYSTVIADDDLISRQYFEYTVSSSVKYQIYASFPDVSEAAGFCRINRPALVLMGIGAASANDVFDAAGKIRHSCSDTKIILAASLPEVSWLRRAEKAGADSFWYKQFQDMPLRDILDRTMQGESVFPKKTPAVQIGNIRSDELTARELEVLRELITGETSKVIAGKMRITEMTVRNHIINMLQKTGFKTRTELAVAARAKGIVIKD